MKRNPADVNLFAGKRTREYYRVGSNLSDQICPSAGLALTWLAGLLDMSTPVLHVDQATVGKRARVWLKFHGIHSCGLRGSSPAWSCSAVR